LISNAGIDSSAGSFDSFYGVLLCFSLQQFRFLSALRSTRMATQILCFSIWCFTDAYHPSSAETSGHSLKVPILQVIRKQPVDNHIMLDQQFHSGQTLRVRQDG